MLHDIVTEQILIVYYKVYNTLGYGFSENVYKNAMALELQKAGLKAQQHKRVRIYYDMQEIGSYLADLVVENRIVVKLKALEVLSREDESELVNCLRATDIEGGLLLNFGTRPEFRKKIFHNYLKKGHRTQIERMGRAV